VDWDGKTGRNVAWKAEVPLPGKNSPVLWGNRVFLSGADGSIGEVFCWDATTGRLLWRSRVPPSEGGAPQATRVSKDTGFAASTLAVNGTRVFAAFATGELAAFDLQGKAAWVRRLGTPILNYGYASSLALLDDGVVVQFDQEENGRLVFFAGEDGSVRWETPRAVLGAWSTPVRVVAGGRARIVTSGTPFLAAYDAETGREAWKLMGLMGENAPSPAFADGRLFVGTQLLSLFAADAATGKKLWEVYDDLPDVSSPVAAAGQVLMAASFGVVTCLDASDGSTLWRQEFPTGFYASPILAGGRYYLLDRSGVMRILAAERKPRLIASPALGEPADATPAFQGGAIYIRGERRLYCIRTAGKAAQ
jgi:outer membrane protein assembly factor BamB